MIQLNRENSEAIYVAKGIAIILVVISHCLFMNGPDYQRWLNDILYAIHVPTFILLSGYLFAGHNVITNLSGYKILIKNKTKRIFIPFLMVGAITLLFKVAGSFFMKPLFPVNLKTCIYFIINPSHSFAPTLWFLYVLYEIFICYGIIYYIVNNGFRALYIFVFIFLLLSFGPWINTFMIGDLARFLPIFAVGYILYMYYNFNKIGWLLGLFSVIFFVILLLFKDDLCNLYFFGRIYGLIIALLGAFSCFSIAMLISRHKNIFHNLLKYIGVFSMVIYLFHTLTMSTFNTFFNMIQFMSHWFFLRALILVSLGVLFPILLEKYIFRKYAILGKLILGVRK